MQILSALGTLPGFMHIAVIKNKPDLEFFLNDPLQVNKKEKGLAPFNLVLEVVQEEYK